MQTLKKKQTGSAEVEQQRQISDLSSGEDLSSPQILARRAEQLITEAERSAGGQQTPSATVTSYSGVLTAGSGLTRSVCTEAFTERILFVLPLST